MILGVDLVILARRGAWRRGFHRVIQVAAAVGIAGTAVGEVHVEIAGGQVDLMTYRPRVEPVAHPDIGCTDAFVPGEIPGGNSEITRVIGDRNVMPKKIVMTLTRTDTAIQHRRVADIVFGVHHAEGVIGSRLAPGLGIVVAHIAGMGNLCIGANLDTLLRRIGIALGVADVRGDTQPLTTKIQANHRHFAVHALVIPLGIAGLFHAVEADAELVVLAKAPAHVHGTAELVVGRVAAGERGDGLVGGALGHHVDPAPDAAPRRNTVDELARSLEDVDALGHFHVDRIGRQDAIEAVIGHIAVEQAETANGELLIPPTRRVGRTHRRIAVDQVAQGSGLLVLDGLAGVGGHAERRFHEVARAQQALGTTTGDLAAGIRLAFLRAGGAEDRGGRQLQAAALRRRGQGVGLFAHRLQLQAGTLQQSGKTLLHPILPRKTGAVATTHQGRVHRQVDSRQPGEAGQCRAEAARRHLVAAPGRFFGLAG
ncbi:hypothetical protein BN844_0523 [Pseudomonas sp. SHC52]|nr:hypothetical protein BN844_0523 [Pseudomonas sp. SHC52]